MPPVRRLAAILAADVVGYSRLMGADEEGTHERVTAHLRQVVNPKIAEHRGRIVKNTGDGMLAEFSSVVDAVRCAVEVQRGMVDREPELSDEQRTRFRIGVNLGDVIVEPEDIFGDGVNIAARLEALAEPGGICISRVVRDQIRDKLPYQFGDMGEQIVKHIARPIRVYSIGASAVAALPRVAAPTQSASVLGTIVARFAALIGFGTAGWRARPTEPLITTRAQPPATATSRLSSPRLSIVVMPFSNLSNDPEQEYFADGITEDLTTDLSRISGSFVIARNTAFAYKGKPVDVKQIGRELGVRYVLEGSVRRTGDWVRVNVQLIDPENGAHLWANRFDTDRANLPEAQNEITGRLARTLNLELVAAADRRIEQERAVDPDARDIVMRGWTLYYRPPSPALRREAQRMFEQALELDARSVDARIGLATILVDDLVFGWSSSPQPAEARAEQLLLEALELDQNRSTTRHAMGVLRRSQNRLTESRIELETAVALDRNDAIAFFQLGVTLMYLGQPEEAISHIEKSIRLNPRDPNLGGYCWALGSCHLLLTHVEQAIDLLRTARTENPRFWYIHAALAGALGLGGDLDEARVALAEAIRLRPEINSLARWRTNAPWNTNPQYWALREKTLNVGLRKAGMPEE